MSAPFAVQDDLFDFSVMVSDPIGRDRSFSAVEAIDEDGDPDGRLIGAGNFGPVGDLPPDQVAQIGRIAPAEPQARSDSESALMVVESARLYDPIFLTAESVEPAHNGNLATTLTVVKTGDQRIDGLLQGTKWNGAITYSDPNSSLDYQTGYNSDQDGDGFSAQFEGFSQLSAQQLLTVHFGLNTALYTQPSGSGAYSVEGFTGLNITYAGAGLGNGTIRVANTTDARTAYAFYPNNSVFGGDAWIGPSGDQPTAGNYDWHTVLHELGHSLGLKHAHETGGFGAVPANVDSVEFTIMTYKSHIGGTNNYSYETWGAPQTFMMLDIAALQHLYGADYSTNSGNTVYTWNPTNGESYVNGVLAIDPGGNRIFSTIWDGGGVDTYNLSNYTTNLRIDLRPGESSTFSSTQLANLGGGPNGGFARGNVFNALLHKGDGRSLIENAYGGSGNDNIIGNQANNLLIGNAGNDVLNPLTGNDTIYGGAGNDVVVRGGGSALQDFYYGGSGTDWISPGAAGRTFVDGVVFDLQAGYLILNGTNYEVWNSFERYANGGGTGHEDVYGTAGANSIYTGSGNNLLDGRAGADLLSGGAGNDTLIGGSGVDNIYGGAGNDVIRFTSGNFRDNVYGGAGVDILDATQQGNSGQVVDLLNGKITGYTGGSTLNVAGIEIYRDGSGSNTIHNASVPNMQIYGGGGDDTIHSGNFASETLDGGAGTDLLDTSLFNGNYAVNLATGRTNFTGERFTNFEDIITGTGNDTVTGTGGDNLIWTDGGNDVVDGGGGNDTIVGGAGDDIYDGAADIDTLDYSASKAGVTVNLRTGVASGTDIGSDKIANFERIIGGSGDDRLVGSHGANSIVDGAGDDTLIGGAGDDILSGGRGDDLFVYGDGDGDDRITDFAGGVGLVDLIDLIGNSKLNSFADVRAATTQVGTATVIDLGDGNSLTLDNFTATRLAADDFIF